MNEKINIHVGTIWWYDFWQPRYSGYGSFELYKFQGWGFNVTAGVGFKVSFASAPDETSAMADIMEPAIDALDAETPRVVLLNGGPGRGRRLEPPITWIKNHSGAEWVPWDTLYTAVWPHMMARAIVVLMLIGWIVTLQTPLFDLGIQGAPGQHGEVTFETAFSGRNSARQIWSLTA